MIPANKTIQHAPYQGSEDVEGYPTADMFGNLIDRKAYGWYAGQGSSSAASASSASNTGGGEYERRLTVYMIVQVPDTTPYSLRDKIILDGEEYWVAGSVMNYNTGPFDFKPGGEVFVQRTTG